MNTKISLFSVQEKLVLSVPAVLVFSHKTALERGDAALSIRLCTKYPALNLDSKMARSRF